MSHRRLPPWLPRAHRHARPRPHDATYHPRPSASPILRKWSCFTVPPRAHPSTSSQSGSATPGRTVLYTDLKDTPNLIHGQDTRANRTRGTGPDTQRAQAHRHAGGSRDTQTVPTRAHSSAGSPSGSAAPGLTQGHQEQDVTIRQKDLFVPWLRSIYLSNRDKPGMDQVFVVWTSKSGLNQMELVF